MTGARAKQMPDGGTFVTATAEWTKHRGEQMGGLVQFKIGSSGDGNTGIILFSQQAPMVA